MCSKVSDKIFVDIKVSSKNFEMMNDLGVNQVFLFRIHNTEKFIVS